jgi:hypothetical protein
VTRLNFKAKRHNLPNHVGMAILNQRYRRQRADSSVIIRLGRDLQKPEAFELFDESIDRIDMIFGVFSARDDKFTGSKQEKHHFRI